MKYGFVYVLSNASMPGLYKVGHTSGSPQARAKALSSATGVPTPFEVVCYAEFANAQQAETYIHTLLVDMRCAKNREFFKGPLTRITDLVLESGYSLSVSRMYVDALLYEEATGHQDASRQGFV